MTISVVQTTPINGFASTNAFTAGLTLGSWLLITGAAYSTGGAAPTANGTPTIGGLTPATTSQVAQKGSPGSSSTVYGAAWLIKVDAALAGAKTIAFAATAATGIVGVVGWETTGWTGTPTLDPATSPALVANGTSNAPSSGTSGTLVNAPAFIAGWIVGFSQSETEPVTGYTTIDGSADGFFPAGWRIATSSGGTFVFATAATGSANWSAGLYALYDAAGGSTPVSAADTGTGTDAATLTAAVTGADSGAGTDAATLKAMLPAADTGAGTDAAALAAAIPGADTGSGADAAGLHAVLAGADTGTGAEAAVIAFTGGDTSSGTDAASMTAAVAGADTGTGADAATVHAAIAAADSGTGADAGSKSVPSAVLPLDPDLLGGGITSDVLAGAITADVLAGAITSDTYGGSIE